MEKLTKEEVLHVAHLARIKVNDEEVEKYSIELKELINDIDKIKEVKSNTDTLLVTPVEHNSILRNDKAVRHVDFNEFKVNLKKTVGRFIEVMVVKK